MDLIGRKADFHSVGCMARAEDRKTKQMPSQKGRGISRGQGRGPADGVGVYLL